MHPCLMPGKRFTQLALASALAAIGLSAAAQEAPQLAEMVQAGTLPPLAERLPQDPLVIPVVDEIGRYGGVLRRA